MTSLNRVTLIGHLGADPDTRYMPSGKPVTNVRLATSENWKDKQTGDKQERTEWHSVVLFKRLAEVAAEHLRKGALVYIEGSLRTRKWQDKEGKDRYTTEIVARELKMLGRGEQSAPTTRNAKPANSAAQPATQPAAQTDGVPFDDDIPF